MSRAAQLAIRAALTGFGLLFALSLGFPSLSGSAETNLPTGKRAGASIVNGRTTTIGQWPWQVGIAVSARAAPRFRISERYFCGGAVLAPRIVITAGHCVADLRKPEVRQLEVISGRTRLNGGRGQVVRVGQLRMPLNEAGKRRYREIDGTANWDVALLLLRSPLRASPIKLAGPDEEDLWSRGRIAWATGWGITKPWTERPSRILRVARQVVMPANLCRRVDGNSFSPATMLCLGGSGGNATTCNGDSGGPLVANSSQGYRLIGVTSFGDGGCRGFVPSVDTQVSGHPVRFWVASTVRRLTGRNVVGSGGTARPVPAWCRIPAVFGLTVPQARHRLKSAGCGLGQVRVDRYARGPRGRIVGWGRYAGWLATPGYRMNVWIAR